MSSHMDPKLAEKILHEVKSQGVFDEFRRDSIADVDTKPAYQNLRQRVENSAQKFLSEQKWSPDMNKHQLRERLRRHITESGFLDVGVERIVDQVVNPKINTVFQPRIEEIAYKFLGVSPPLPTKREPPLPPPMPPLPPFPPLNGSPLKVETNTPLNLLPTDLEQVSPDSDKMKEEDMSDIGALEEKADDDDESPPFEPLAECKSPKSEVNVKKEDLSEKECADVEPKKEIVEKVESIKEENIKSEESCAPKEKSASNDALASQESQLSQVSSDSRLSSASNQLLQRVNDATSAMDKTDVDISEEAQMPKFNENSTGTEDSVKSTSELHFDIKKDEIKFEGTERKPNMLDSDGTEFSKDAPIIKDAFISDSLEMKGSFHFTKLNVEVEPCNNTHGAASSVSSQDDTSSAQLCIVERPENELLGETNSIQKCPQEDSSTNTTITNSQVKQSDSKSDRNGKQSSSSSSSSSRPKKSSSKDKKHSSEKDRYYDKKDRSRSKYRERDQERDRERYRDRDRYSDAKHSSKTSSSSSRRHESRDKHRSSSKRSEKDPHVSSSSRSESRSHHKSSKRDHHDKYDKKKSHKVSSSSKEHRSEDRKSRTDDHTESRGKIHRRKSTDSNDEDKNPSSQATPNYTSRQTKGSNDTESTSNVNSKSTSNGSNKHCKETKKSASHESKRSDSTKINNSRVVILNDALENPSTNFIELEAKSSVQIHTMRKRSPTLCSETNDMDLLYFEQVSSQLQARLDLINDAIDRCRTVINAATTPKEHFENDITSEDHDDKTTTSVESATEMHNMIKHAGTKATLLVDCYHYSDCTDQNAVENVEGDSPKRLKLSTECNIGKFSTISGVSVCTKENQMKENNSRISDDDNKPTLSKRMGTLAKLSQQQRYSSEDLYKPRPVLGQRSKRRGLDTVM